MMMGLDLDQQISDLKGEGKSLREIASALGISHMAVSRKLKRMGVTDNSSCNTPCNTVAKPHKIRVSGEFGTIGKQVVTETTPSPNTNKAVTPALDAVGGRLERLQSGVEGVSGGLIEEIRQYLENRGIEMYPLKVEMEAYQVEHNGETLRIYVKRKTE